MSMANDDTIRTVTGAEIAAGNALPFGEHSVMTMGVAPEDADIQITGVRRVFLWASKKKAIMRLVVAPGETLTMKQLVRALQCGYLVSAHTACKWGEYKDMIRSNVAAGCHISTNAMPHRVDYLPTWKVDMAHGLPLDGYDASMSEDGDLDVMLRINADDQRIAA